MKRKFFEVGGLTKAAWFWSRLGHILSIIYMAGILFWVVMSILDFLKKWYEPNNMPIVVILILWICGGICALHACNIFGGFTFMSSKNPWDN